MKGTILKTKIFVIEDDEQLGELLANELTACDYRCRLYRTIDGVLEACKREATDESMKG